jgi:hypothetical protein
LFQRLTHRLDADRVDQAEHDHLISQELQGPTAPAPGRVGASQFDELLFDVPLDLDLVRSGGLRSVIEGRLESLGDEPLPDAGDGPRAGAQGGDDLFIGVFLSPGVVRQQEDARMGQLASRGLALGNQLLQRRPLLRSQGDSILLHRSAPVLRAVALLRASTDRIPNSPVNRRLKAH